MHKTKNLKKKITTVCFSFLGVVFFSIVIYVGGLLNSVNGLNKNVVSQGIRVQGVPNKVEYLQALTLTGRDGVLKMKYSTNSGHLEIKGSVNMDSLVVGSGNTADSSSAVFGGRDNNAQGYASAVVGGFENTLSNSSNSIIAASQNIKLYNSHQVFIGGADKQNSTSDSQNVLIFGNSKATDARNALIIGDEHNVNSSRSAVVFGQKVGINQKDNIFVYSNHGDGFFTPQEGNAFYVNAQNGVAVNHTQPVAQLDINGGLVLKSYNTLREGLPQDVRYKGTIAMVQKGQEIGLCGYDGKEWIPLSQSAKEKNLCIKGGVCNIPENASKTSDQNSCEWSCNPGFAHIGSELKCYPVSWQAIQTPAECKENGRYNEGKITTNYQCTVSDPRSTHHGKVVDDARCQGVRPPQTQQVVYKSDCNAEENRWSCDPLTCTAAGECGGVQKVVNCTIDAINQNLVSYKHTQQKIKTCDRICEYGVCGSWHRGQAVNLRQNTQNLCSYGSVQSFSQVKRANILAGWEWSCSAKDSIVNCETRNQIPGSAKCGTRRNSCRAGVFMDVADSISAFKWACNSPVPNANDVDCSICKPGFKHDANKNCIPVAQCADELIARAWGPQGHDSSADQHYYIGALDTHQYNLGLGNKSTSWSTFYYSYNDPAYSPTTYDSTWCKLGRIDRSEFDTIYEELKSYKKPNFTYHCIDSDNPQSKVACNVGVKSHKNLYLDRYKSDYSKGFKVERCPDGTTLQNGACAKSCRITIPATVHLYTCLEGISNPRCQRSSSTLARSYFQNQQIEMKSGQIIQDGEEIHRSGDATYPVQVISNASLSCNNGQVKRISGSSAQQDSYNLCGSAHGKIKITLNKNSNNLCNPGYFMTDFVNQRIIWQSGQGEQYSWTCSSGSTKQKCSAVSRDPRFGSI